MDKQLEFLMHWSGVCEPLVEYFVDCQARFGKEMAIDMWVDRNNTYFKKTYPEGETVIGDNLARDIFMCACVYVDLLIRWGVFDDHGHA